MKAQPKLPARYHYTLKQTNLGRYCLLTADCDRVQKAVNGEGFSGSYSSDEKHEPQELEKLVEKGVSITRRDVWEDTIKAAEGLPEIYPNATPEKLIAMGFSEVELAPLLREALAKNP